MAEKTHKHSHEGHTHEHDHVHDHKAGKHVLPKVDAKPQTASGAEHKHAKEETTTAKTKALEAKKDAVKPGASGAAKKDSTETKVAKKAKPKKPKEKSRKVKVKKTKEVIAMRNKVLGKTAHPIFRGRFGNREIRRKSKEKWDKWRVPRGGDVKHEMNEGYMPKEGYRTPRAIRGVHPSGYPEVMIKTIYELEGVPKMHAIRVAANIGRKKKMMLVDKAIEKGIKVLNP